MVTRLLKPAQPSSNYGSRGALHGRHVCPTALRPGQLVRSFAFLRWLSNGSKRLIGAAGVIIIRNAKIMLAMNILALARSLGRPLVLRLLFG